MKISPSAPVHVPCATSGSVQVDCHVRRVGDLIRTVGYGTMDFTPCDAMDLARAIAILAVECGYRNGEELAHVSGFWRRLAVECGWDDPNIDDGR